MSVFGGIMEAMPILYRTLGPSGKLAQMVAEEIARQRGVSQFVAEQAVERAMVARKRFINTHDQLVEVAALTAQSLGVAPPIFTSERPN